MSESHSRSMILRTSSLLIIKAKDLQKQVEKFEKTSSDLLQAKQKQFLIQQNSVTLKSFVEQRNYFTDHKARLHSKINALISEIQGIKKNTEFLHQESRNFISKASEYIAERPVNGKLIEDSQKELEKINKEVCKKREAKVSLEKKVSEAVKALNKTTRMVELLERRIKSVEALKHAEIDSNRQVLKQIIMIEKQIAVFRNRQ